MMTKYIQSLVYILLWLLSGQFSDVRAYDPTIPQTIYTHCSTDICPENGGPASYCFWDNYSISSPFTCADVNGCYTGSPIGDTCLTNIPLEQSCDEKRYRLSSAVGYNAPNALGPPNFSAFKLVFSAIDTTAGLPDKEYQFGSTIGSES